MSHDLLVGIAIGWVFGPTASKVLDEVAKWLLRVADEVRR